MGPSLDLAIQQFLDHLKVERELTPATVEAYGRDLAAFAHFARRARGRHRWHGVADRDHARSTSSTSWSTSPTAALGPRSQARRLIALRQLFKFLKAERVSSIDPTEDVDLPRFGRKLARLPDRRRGRPAAGRARPPHRARAARRRHAGDAVRDRPAGLRAGQAAPARRELRRRIPRRVRQGARRSAWSRSARWRSPGLRAYVEGARAVFERVRAHRTRCSSPTAAAR